MQRPAWLPSLFIGVIATLFGTVPISVVELVSSNGVNWEHWNELSTGCMLVQSALVTAGLFAFVGRLSGAQRTLVVIAASLWALLLAWDIARPVLFMLYDDHDQDVWQYGWNAMAFVQLAAVTVLAVAARAWARPIAAIAAIGAIGASIVTYSMPWIGSRLLDFLFDDPKRFDLFLIVHEIAFVLSVIGLLHALARDAREPQPNPRLAARALRRLAVAMCGLVAAAGAAAGLRYFHGIDPWASIAVVGALVAIVTAVLDVERSWVTTARLRLALGTAFVVLAISMFGQQTLVAFVHHESYMISRAPVWESFAPVLVLVGMALLASALITLASTIEYSLRLIVVNRVVAFLILGFCGALAWILLRLSALHVSAVLLVIAAFTGGAFAMLISAIVHVARGVDSLPQFPEAKLR